MKKTLSMLLAVLFVLSAFGGISIFGRVLGVSAADYDYYVYESFPGLTGFTNEEMGKLYNEYSVFTESATINDAPAVSYEITGGDTWGGASFTSAVVRNRGAEHNKQNIELDYAWCALDLVNGKDIFGDTGITFDEKNGFCVDINVNGQPYDGTIQIFLHCGPTQGPYYKTSEDGSTDMIEYGTGHVYAANNIKGEVDGRFYLDFKTDFKQCDWWSKDDNGINQYNYAHENGMEVQAGPLPKAYLPLFNCIKIRLSTVKKGDTVTIGNFRTYTDTRIHTDELEEYIDLFDSLNPEAYTEDSYAVATDSYLKACEMLIEPTLYRQKDFDDMVKELKAAIEELKPLFMAKNKQVNLAGFEVWDDADFDEISSGGYCLDTPMVDYDNVPSVADQSILIMGNAQDGEPTYGWSLFTNSVDNEGEVAAVKNPFTLLEGSEPLSAASGIRFWIKWDASLDPIPSAMRIGLGSSADGVCFECEDTALNLPETEGFVGAAWTSFFDTEGEADIFDYIDSLDYISIYVEGAVGIYYVAALQAFVWDVSSADFAPLRKAIDDARAYMDTLSINDWGPISWDKVFIAIDDGEELIGKYGATDEDVADAIDNINSRISKLVPIKDSITRETRQELENAYKAAKTYWRGNVTAASYRDLMLLMSDAAEMLTEDVSEADGAKMVADLNGAIAALVPVKAGEKVTSILSFEDYGTRDLNKATGDRTEGVNYSLDKTNPKLPEGYEKALCMEATTDMGSETTDEHGMMQFKAMYRQSGNNSVIPIMLGPNDENTLIGDLTGTDGLKVWVGVNDVNLVQSCTMRFAVSNCTSGPLFEMAAIDIPIPATGSGWITLPWEYFEYYDEWTKGEPINLAKIYFYIIRFDGEIKSGLKVYITGIHAYKNSTAGTWNDPTIYNITEGQEIDTSEAEFIPDWSEGSATLDGKFLIYGNPVPTNGEHTLVVTNGNKSKTVHFSTAGAVIDPTPVISGVEDDGIYEESATPTWDVGTATLNGEEFTSGTEITEYGTYTLIVTNGNAEPVEITFRVIEKQAPQGMPGDLDGDEEITVTDALTTLRFAAKLAVPNETEKALADVDYDGEVTVTDALAILRVAAKLADASSLVKKPA